MDRRVTLGVGGCLSLFLLYTGAKASWTIIFVLLVCIAMLWFAAYLAQDVLSKDEGTKEMQEVGLVVQLGMWRRRRRRRRALHLVIAPQSVGCAEWGGVGRSGSSHLTQLRPWMWELCMES